MKKTILFISLISTLLFGDAYKGKYLFVVGDLAVREEQLKLTQEFLKLMSCIDSDNILPAYFNSLIKNQNNHPNDYVDFYKLLVYSASYKVAIDEKVISIYKNSSRKGKCKNPLITDQDFYFYKKILELEVFLRSRFQVTGEANTRFRLRGIRSLLESLRDQIKVDYLEYD